MPKAAAPTTESTADAGPKPLRGGLAKLLRPSPELAAIVGADPLPRSTTTAEVWKYIHAQGLQDQTNKREIVADDRLRPIIGDRCGMFDLPRHLSAHLHPLPAASAT